MSHGVRNSQTQPFLPSTRSPVSSDSTTGRGRIDVPDVGDRRRQGGGGIVDQGHQVALRQPNVEHLVEQGAQPGVGHVGVVAQQDGEGAQPAADQLLHAGRRLGRGAPAAARAGADAEVHPGDQDRLGHQLVVVVMA